ncbi:MAG TPA: right-handed parallel beta-helix repeat-containing protein [Kofleriaceae bacterium]|jgi:parallel beta-helix repeat protein|nr:right-handed parallel beta-helix repeat-containing protein [Kofleriaceae bacterium]
MRNLFGSFVLFPVALAACGGSDHDARSDAGAPLGDAAHDGAPSDGDGGGVQGPEMVPPAPDYDDIGIQVAPTGDDATGDGTEAKPYRTIGHVLAEVAQPGDTIILRDGVYNEQVRIRQPNITIRSHSGEWGVISQPITIDGNNPMVPVLFDVDSDGSKLQRVEVTGGFYAIQLFTNWGSGGSDTLGATNITIEDSKIHDTGRDCIKITPQSDGFTIRRSEIYNSGKGYPPNTPPDDMNAEGIDAVNADDFLVQDCYIHDTATTGVYFKGGSTNGVVERTRVLRTGAFGIALGFDTSLEWFDTVTNPGYYENIDGTVRNCIVEDTRYAGIAMYAARNPKVINNTIINSAKVGHSPIYFGITFQDWDPNAGRPANVNPVVVNNIVAQPSGGDCVFIRHSDELGGLDALSGPATIDNNIYFGGSAACTFTDRRAGGVEAVALAAWRTHLGGDASSLETAPALTADGHLEAGSPAIDRGQNREEVTYDFDREMRTGTFDIGADER